MKPGTHACIYRDIPIGILHWLYLGLGKHLIKACLEDLADTQRELLTLLIESCDQSAFHTKICPDTVTYIDSRQGKDIKTYVRGKKYLNVWFIFVKGVLYLQEFIKDFITWNCKSPPHTHLPFIDFNYACLIFHTPLFITASNCSIPFFFGWIRKRQSESVM